MNIPLCKFKIISKRSLYLPFKNVIKPSILYLLPKFLTRAPITKNSVHSLAIGSRIPSLSLWIMTTKHLNLKISLRNRISLSKAKPYCRISNIKQKISWTRKISIWISVITSSKTLSDLPTHISTYFNSNKYLLNH